MTCTIWSNGCSITCWIADQSGLVDLDAPTIVLAHDLTPSETARLDRRWVRGFVTEAGGEGGHTAILARGLELPAVVGPDQSWRMWSAAT